MTNITLTKQAAARRLILNGIRMANRSDDPLAIHVVAASAVNMIRELLEQRGSGLAALGMRYGFYKAAKARAEGRQSGLPTYEALDSLLDQIAGYIKDGSVNSEEDITLTLPPGEERRMLDSILRPFNFLKHAQRDPLATLNEEDVLPIQALVHALAAFAFLFPGEPLPDEAIAFVKDNEIV